MKRILLVVFALSALTPLSISAQSAAARKEIRNKTCPDAEVKAVKIGPSKPGYLASCAASGANRSEFVFENSRLLYDGAAISFLKTVHLGYYDLSEYAYSPSGGSVETKKWNGSSYVRIKCQEFDINNSGKAVRYRPCSF
jgi:hypothetical protein